MSTGWAEFREIPFEYNDQVKQIDEQLLRLVAARKSITGAAYHHPDQKIIDEWVERLDMREEDIRHVLRSVQPMPKRPFIPQEETKLTGVLPIMKQTTQDGCEYVITHAMQYDHESIVHLDIHHRGPRAEHVFVKPQLMLEVTSVQGEHMVLREGSRGSGSDAQLSYRVVPALPPSLEQVKFSLIPAVHELEIKMEEVILDKHVDFK